MYYLKYKHNFKLKLRVADDTQAVAFQYVGCCNAQIEVCCLCLSAMA